MSTQRPLPRLFVEGGLAAGLNLALTPAQSHYLVSVLRCAGGDGVLLINGRDGEWLASIVEAHRKHAILSCIRQTRPMEVCTDLWLLFAPIKRGRIDWLAEKACELGIARLAPVITARTIVGRVAEDRLLAHMIEAAEQCGRTSLPTLAPVQPLATVLRDWPSGRTLFVCDEGALEPGGPALADLQMALQSQPPATGGAAIFIGPEGGFTPAERAMLHGHPAAQPVGLGPRILRADTAAVAALCLWQALHGDWGKAAQPAPPPDKQR